MKSVFLAVLASFSLLIAMPDVSAKGGSRSHSSSRPYYGGGKHTESHGGTYQGGQGSSHRGGTYKNPRSGDQYGQHK